MLAEIVSKMLSKQEQNSRFRVGSKQSTYFLQQLSLTDSLFDPSGDIGVLIKRTGLSRSCSERSSIVCPFLHRSEDAARAFDLLV